MTDMEIEARMDRIENRFVALSDDFTELRHEVNELEELIDRRT